MKQRKLSIRYVISIAKINKRGLSPISCRLTYKKKRKPFATGLFVNPSCWDAKKQKAISNSMENEQVNQQLQITSANIKKEYLKLQLTGTEFTVDEIFQGFLGKPVQKETYVIAYFQEYLLKRKKLIGIDIQLATWKKFNYACSQAKDFIKWKYGTQDLPLKKLKLQFLHDFEYYLKIERKQGQVTINKALQRFRRPICIAVAEGT